MSLIDTIKQIAKRTLQKAFSEQGHNLTGATVLSVESRATLDKNSFTVSVYAYEHLKILDNGTPPNRIPYGGRRGTKSKYIEALKRYAMKRMRVSSKEALGIAFAIARAQKRDGMPTKASRRFSRTGQRKNFVAVAIENASKQTAQAIQKETSLLLQTILKT